MDVTKTALRSWWTIVAGICLGLAAAVWALEVIPPKFEATATVFADPSDTPGEVSQRLTAFEDALLQDPSLAERVRQTYGLAEHDEALPGLMREVRNNFSWSIAGSQHQGSDAVSLSYRDRDAQRAALTVNTLAEFYVARNSVGSSAGRPGRPVELKSAAIPTVAYSPRPIRVYGVFLILGWLLFSGPVVARGFLHPVISTETGFGALSELPVLAIIPAAPTAENSSSARRRFAKNVTLSMLSGAVLVGTLVFAGMG